MISFYALSKRLFLKRKALSDARVVSITKREYGFPVKFLEILVKSFKSIFDEWLNGICWNHGLLRVFIRKMYLDLVKNLSVIGNKGIIIYIFNVL